MSDNVVEYIRYCASSDCRNIAGRLQCPTCVKNNLPPTFYCSQDCFKSNWSVHKYYHGTSYEPEDADWVSWRPEFRGFQFLGDIRPGRLTPRREIPDSIMKPDYADDIDGIPYSENAQGEKIIVYSDPEDLQNARDAGRLTAEVLSVAGKVARPGVTTDEIDRVVHEACIERNCYPSTLNYNTFMKSCCTSVNEIVCHGIPDSRELEDGDILNLDVCVYYNGFHGDMNETWFIGDVDEASQHLVNTTKQCLDLAIEASKPGCLYRDLGNIISKHAQNNGLSVVRSFCGHGVGKFLHGAPNVPHYGKNRAIGVMKEGHIFTIEPMINMGAWRDVIWPDDWTSSTRDGKRSAQFEHTLLVTATGVEILTARGEGDYINRM